MSNPVSLGFSRSHFLPPDDDDDDDDDGGRQPRPPIIAIAYLRRRRRAGDAGFYTYRFLCKTSQLATCVTTITTAVSIATRELHCCRSGSRSCRFGGHPVPSHYGAEMYEDWPKSLVLWECLRSFLFRGLKSFLPEVREAFFHKIKMLPSSSMKANFPKC